ncbi:MAG: T9SS type A sorting domain-containing protein [Flavobacteriia bacterium]|nr:T9SS type A sorting domain-containing protein [Flavobacteriia bacterium]
MKLLYFNFLLFSLSLTSIFSQVGYLDNSFGTNGKVSTNIGNYIDGITCVELQLDGKIVAAGYSYVSNYEDVVIVRYNSDGTLDNTFGLNGVVIQSLGNESELVKDIYIQNDGKIILTGNTTNSLQPFYFVTRYNNDGTLDNSFNGSGIILNDASTSGIHFNSIAVQPDNKIILGGAAKTGNFWSFSVARLNQDGSFDTTFDNDGIVIREVVTGYNEVFSIGLFSNGKIIAAGNATNGNDNDFALVSFNSDGSINEDFGGINFKVTTDMGNSQNNFLNDMKVLTNDALIVGGFFDSTFDNINFALAKYNSNGELDTSFGTNGMVHTDFGTSFDDAIHEIEIQYNGSIIACGNTVNNGYTDFGISKYSPNGVIDESFGQNGFISTDYFQSNDNISCSKLQTDGKLIVCGSTYDGSKQYFALARYNIDSLTNTNDLFANKLAFYPNPTKNELYFNSSSNQNYEISIYNLLGEEVLHDYLSLNKQKIDVQNFENGVYFIKLNNNSKDMITKFIKE